VTSLVKIFETCTKFAKNLFAWMHEGLRNNSYTPKFITQRIMNILQPWKGDLLLLLLNASKRVCDQAPPAPSGEAYPYPQLVKGEDDREKRRDRTGKQGGKMTKGKGRGVVPIFKNVVASWLPVTLLHHFILTHSEVLLHTSAALISISWFWADNRKCEEVTGNV